MVSNIFKKLLPKCEIHANNFYNIAGETGKSKWCENDLLIKYDDCLIIVEIKAGSYFSCSPLLNKEVFFSSLNKLIEESSSQCERIREYLNSNSSGEIDFYEKNYESVKFRINMSEIRDIYLVTVSIDNINTIANKAYILDSENKFEDVVCLSVDELLVYRDYFDGPLYFMNYLKYRRNVVKNKNVMSDDELNYLGLYIINENFDLLSDEEKKADSIYYMNMRDDLDLYFNSKVTKDKTISQFSRCLLY